MKILKSYFTLVNVIRVLTAIFLNIILIYLFVNGGNNLTKMALSPFCLCGLSVLGHTISSITNNYKMMRIFEKSYALIFLLFWFGFLIFFTHEIIKGKDYSTVLFTIPFWGIGFYITYQTLFQKN